MTRFIYALEEPQEDAEVSLRIAVEKKRGTVEDLTIANGATILKDYEVLLEHKPEKQGRTESAIEGESKDDYALDVSGTWRYKSESNSIVVKNVDDSPIEINYDWSGEKVQVFSYAFACG